MVRCFSEPVEKREESIMKGLCFGGFKNESSRSYFRSEVGQCGFSNIVAGCQFGMPHLGQKLSRQDVLLQADLARLTYAISRGQREMLARVLEQVVAKGVRDLTASEQKDWVTKVPTTAEEMRSMFIDGKNSMAEMIPMPAIEKVGSHRYISLEENIRDLLGHGLRTEVISIGECDQKRRLSDSDYCKVALEKCEKKGVYPVIPLFLTEWSDGYDPNGTSKANRASVWIKLVTLSAPHDKRNDVGYTYPIALGRGKICHEEVEKRFKDELLKFGHVDSNELFFPRYITPW
jgi:hypothetical protein